MALITRSGSVTTTSLPTDNDYLFTPVNVRPTPDKEIIDRVYVQNTTQFKNAINVRVNEDLVQRLRGFISGSPLVVTYFYNMPHPVNGTVWSDISTGTHSSHNYLVQVNQFEMRLAAGFDFSYLQDEARAALSGTATTYPGFNPNMGDFFLYQMKDGRLGQFKVNQVPQRLSITNGTCYEITFELFQFMSTEDITALKASVREVAWFNKRRFLTQPGAMISADENMMLQDIVRVTGALKDYYTEEFLDRVEYRSYRRPDGLYDPYVVEFMSHITSYMDVIPRPVQLVARPDGWKRSIWYKLIKPDFVPWKHTYLNYITPKLTATVRESRLNALLNREWLKLTADEYDPCVPPAPNVPLPYISPNLSVIAPDPADLDPFDELLRMYFDEGAIDPNSLIDQASMYEHLEPMDQYYRIPIYMYLLSKLREQIVTGRGDIRYDTSGCLPSRVAFTKEHLGFKDGILTLESRLNNVLGIIDNENVQWRLESGEVVYSDYDVRVDLRSILAQKPATSDPEETWKEFTNDNLDCEGRLHVVHNRGVDYSSDGELLEVYTASGTTEEVPVIPIDENSFYLDMRDHRPICGTWKVLLPPAPPSSMVGTWYVVMSGGCGRVKQADGFITD